MLPPLIAAALLAELSSISAAAAGQPLFPVPCPELLGPNARIGGASPMTAAHEHLLPDPVPQSLAPNALGNPRLAAATGISSFCQRPTDANIYVGARTASSPRESLHLESCARSTRVPRKPRGASFETPTSWASQDEGAGANAPSQTFESGLRASPRSPGHRQSGTQMNESEH